MSGVEYLRGFVAGYWQACDAFTTGVDEDDGGSASCGDPAPTSAGPLDLGSLPLRGSLPSSSGPAYSSPAINQPALPDEVRIELAGELESTYIHRGVVTGLTVMAEAFRTRGMHDAELMCQQAIRGVEFEIEQR